MKHVVLALGVALAAPSSAQSAISGNCVSVGSIAGVAMASHQYGNTQEETSARVQSMRTALASPGDGITRLLDGMASIAHLAERREYQDQQYVVIEQFSLMNTALCNVLDQSD